MLSPTNEWHEYAPPLEASSERAKKTLVPGENAPLWPPRPSPSPLSSPPLRGRRVYTWVWPRAPCSAADGEPLYTAGLSCENKTIIEKIALYLFYYWLKVLGPTPIPEHLLAYW